jgi:transcription initiation factor TFIIH subunit 3
VKDTGTRTSTKSYGIYLAFSVSVQYKRDKSYNHFAIIVMPKSSNTLLTIILDVSPLAWGEREALRQSQDKAREAAGKRSVGPAVLEEVLESIQAFGNAVVSIERSAGLIILAVADNESAVVYPRKDELNEWLEAPDSYSPDTRRVQHDLIHGVNELVQRAATKSSLNTDPGSRQGAMAASFSKGLCVVNRFLVAAKSGVSALHKTHYMERDEEGIIALSSGKRKKMNSASAAWSPRILLIQASDDRSRDYNAFMNCAFSATKLNVVVDGCFLTDSAGKTSSFLEQTCDLTGGLFLAPAGAAQVGGTLTEVLFAVFLPNITSREKLNLPALHKVDFRARCFATSETVDKAFVCNQCLSIYKNKPTCITCPTCQAKIVGNS